MTARRMQCVSTGWPTQGGQHSGAYPALPLKRHIRAGAEARSIPAVDSYEDVASQEKRQSPVKAEAGRPPRFGKNIAGRGKKGIEIPDVEWNRLSQGTLGADHGGG